MLDVPKRHETIVSGGRQDLAVRAECHRIDSLSVPRGEGAKGDGRLVWKAPQFHHCGAGSRKKAPVRTACDRTDLLVIALKGWAQRNWMLRVRDLPEAHLSTLITHHQNVPPRTERQRNDGSVANHERMSDSGWGRWPRNIPQLDRTFACGRKYGLVGAERHRRHLIIMPQGGYE
jgi:hypothetical protein